MKDIINTLIRIFCSLLILTFIISFFYFIATGNITIMAITGSILLFIIIYNFLEEII